MIKIYRFLAIISLITLIQLPSPGFPWQSELQLKDLCKFNCALPILYYFMLQFSKTWFPSILHSLFFSEEWMFSELSCVRLKNHEDGRYIPFSRKVGLTPKKQSSTWNFTDFKRNPSVITIPIFENYLLRYLSLEG